MLAPLLIVELVSCILLILAGWIGDQIRAGWRDHGPVRPASYVRTANLRYPWSFDDSDTTWSQLPCKH
jgi:hypothetical protein